MLQRAASNAYSWWWASHIRTKQSKWLEQNLQDMEEKTGTVLKMISEEGDSFAKRAEMYYKNRPELINFVEESYRAYRALAERYDHISTELQNANNTIASVCPEQVQFAMVDEDDIGSPTIQKKPRGNSKEAPKVPKLPTKEVPGTLSAATKAKKNVQQPEKSKKSSDRKSGLTKSEGRKEIERLQKQILALQTEKEFVKSSYESGLEKYKEKEEEIRGMQEKVFKLEDEFGEPEVMDDDVARNLMAATALKSCKDMTAHLRKKQKRSVKEAEAEQKRIKVARDKVNALKKKFELNQAGDENDNAAAAVKKSKRLEEVAMIDATLQIKEMEQFDFGESLSVQEMVEKIDQLVGKVNNLETAISSRKAIIHCLRMETDELYAQIQCFNPDENKDVNTILTEMEEKLCGIEELNHSIEDQNNRLQTHFSEAKCNIDQFSDKLGVEVLEELDKLGSSKERKKKDKEKKRKKKKDKADKELEVTDALEIGSKNLQPEEMAAASDSLVEVELPKESEQKEDKVDDDDQNTKLEGREAAVEEEKLDDNDNELKDRDTELEEEEVVEGDKLDDDTNVKDTELQETHEVVEGDKPVADDFTQDMKLEGMEEVVEGDKFDDDFTNSSDTKSEEKEEVVVGDQLDDDNTKLEEEAAEQKEAEKEHDDEDGDISSPSEKHGADLIGEEIVDETSDTLASIEPEEEDETKWEELLMKSVEGGENSFLTGYTTMLRNYKDTKKKLIEVENKKQNGLFEITMQLKELKSTNAKKDEEIRVLRARLCRFRSEDDNTDPDVEISPTSAAEKEVEEGDGLSIMLLSNQSQTSEIEEKFRMDIDELLEENLDFWLRFSSTFYEIQKFETGVKDLVDEVSKLEERAKQEGNSNAKYSVQSDVRPLYKHLREIQAELAVWVEKNILLKEELKNRFSSLCEIQEEITRALKVSAEDDNFTFTTFQAAKFQGEILNMKQENNKVADELQAGLDHITSLQLHVEKALTKLTEDWGMWGGKTQLGGQLQHADSRSRVPLRSFIFGVKQKKQKTSIFSYVHPRKSNRSGLGNTK